jgi:lysine/ornithine N-monooxygenase
MENARIARQRRRMIMNEKMNRGGIIVGSGSRSKKVRKYNDVQPTDSTTQSMINNRNEMENERLAHHKRQKTSRGVMIVGCGSSSSQVRDHNSLQPTDATAQSTTERRFGYSSNTEDIPSKLT